MMRNVHHEKNGVPNHFPSVCRKALALFLFSILLLGSAVAGLAESLGQGEELYRQALAYEEQREYTQASELFLQALPLLQQDGNDSLAADCAMRAERTALFVITYPHTLDELKDLIRTMYPQASEEEIELWTAPEEVEHAFFDGEEHYFEETASNLAFRHLELMRADAARVGAYYDLALKVNRLAENVPQSTWMQYHSPAVYRGTHTITIPRDELPDRGTYRVWIPIPINNGPQADVVVESITPEKWVKQPPSFDQDIGLIYLEIPMEDLKEDLSVQAVFTFTHYEQSFRVDPANVGEYDTESALYRQYTSSYGNTEITPDIRLMAETIAGDTDNPYLAARKIYDYIVHNVTYALMPHMTFWPRTELTESDYVHRHQRGDCGAQSMYFTAMCRALGIPARTTGGWQLFTGQFGSHFWAEFFLPNYGWVPVDTSFGQLALFPDNLSDAQRQTFIDYCFASQDSMRCVVQKDTDAPLIPAAEGIVLLPLAIQLVSVENTIPTGDLSLPFIEYSTLTAEKISGD